MNDAHAMLTFMTRDPIEVAKVEFDHRVEALVLAVLRSGHIAQGPMVEAMEDAIARIVGVRHAVAVNNGTASLIAALHVHGIGRGDEVVTSPFTFIATLNAILAVGARPRFADIDPGTFTLLPASVDALVTSRTRAVMPVHIFGHPADMTSISAIAERRELVVIEDCAQALGALHLGRAVGSFGVGSFSFYATKTVTTGEGGVLTTNDGTLARSLREYRNQGIGESRRHVAFGLNLRLTDLQAATSLPQLEDLSCILDRRAQNAALLSDGLDGVDGLKVPTVREGERHAFHQYTVRVETSCRLTRDELQEALTHAGISSAVHYRSLAFDHPYLRDQRGIVPGDCPTARAMTTEVLSLPVHQHLTHDDVADVISAVRKVLV